MERWMGIKRIINGVTYDTGTATEVFSESHNRSGAWWGIYQTRHGAFFKVVCDHDEMSHTFSPLGDEAALTLLEKHANHLVEKFFGSMPEHGSAERRLTVRLPAGLARRLEDAAGKRGLTVNRFVMRGLEHAVAQAEAG